ncbi:gamma-glutamyl-gamma-aminobutyrate hydrolase family protein [Acetobacteraceae bacterium H6797]|nr:gamma-glutamyl-gamma-aminobutyrate hydrolase family protein [Acetobacteraceae bacterium H6797]
MHPLIGIPCCIKAFGVFGMPNHAVSDHYIKVVRGPVGGMPVALPAIGEDISLEILPRLDGLLLTGSRSNVCPTYYDGPAHATGTPEDHERDETTLPLIRKALEIGLPLFAICRGMQELNVALGGSLDQRIQDLPGRMDHSTPSEQALPKARTGKAHAVNVAQDSTLQRLWADLPGHGKPVMVNSLHNQGVARLASRLTVEARAPDGTVEAVRVTDAKGFAMGVQWHPEYDWQTDSRSRRLFDAFGAAAAQWASRRSGLELGKLAAD